MQFLNDHERAQLRVQHKKERDGRIRDRIKAVLLYDRGWTPQQIAEALLISDQAIREHVQEYRGSHKLKPVSGGSEEKLSEEQSNKLAAHLESYTYLYVKDIVAYVRATFEAAYSVPGMTHWLRRHRFSYKKPAVVPGYDVKRGSHDSIFPKNRGGLPHKDPGSCIL